MTRSLDQALVQGADISAMANSNLLVNGFHNVSQQVGSTAVPTSGSGVYVTDQWVSLQVGSWAGNFQQVASPFPSQPDIPYGLQVQVTTAEPTLGAGDQVRLDQPLEGTNLVKLLYGSANAKPVTLAFMVRSSINMVGYVSLASFNNAGSPVRSYVQRYYAPANTDTFVLMVIPGDVAQALVTSNLLSMRVRWCFGSGSTYIGPVGQWNGTNNNAGADITNLAAAVGNTAVISGAVLLPGVVPITQAMLPLLARQYDDELRKCQRYWQSQLVTHRFKASAASDLGSSGFIFPVVMRTDPTWSLIAAGQRTNLNSVGIGAFKSGGRIELNAAAAGDVYALFDQWAFTARM